MINDIGPKIVQDKRTLYHIVENLQKKVSPISLKVIEEVILEQKIEVPPTVLLGQYKFSRTEKRKQRLSMGFYFPKPYQPLYLVLPYVKVFIGYYYKDQDVTYLKAERFYYD